MSQTGRLIHIQDEARFIIDSANIMITQFNLRAKKQIPPITASLPPAHDLPPPLDLVLTAQHVHPVLASLRKPAGWGLGAPAPSCTSAGGAQVMTLASELFAPPPPIDLSQSQVLGRTATVFVHSSVHRDGVECPADPSGASPPLRPPLSFFSTWGQRAQEGVAQGLLSPPHAKNWDDEEMEAFIAARKGENNDNNEEFGGIGDVDELDLSACLPTTTLAQALSSSRVNNIVTYEDDVLDGLDGLEDALDAAINPSSRNGRSPSPSRYSEQGRSARSPSPGTSRQHKSGSRSGSGLDGTASGAGRRPISECGLEAARAAGGDEGTWESACRDPEAAKRAFENWTDTADAVHASAGQFYDGFDLNLGRIMVGCAPGFDDVDNWSAKKRRGVSAAFLTAAPKF